MKFHVNFKFLSLSNRAKNPSICLIDGFGMIGKTICSVSHIGQQGDLTGALDGDGQLTLMHGTGAGGTTGQDLAALGNVTAQFCGILIIDLLNLVHAEGTNLSALTAARTSIISHNRNLLI